MTPDPSTNSAASANLEDPSLQVQSTTQLPSPFSPGDWKPTASLENLKQRAQLTRAVRDFFHHHDYWEVETPLLCRDTVIDLYLEPFAVRGDWGTGGQNETKYLQTSPEFCMKRLVSAGAERIFQITKAFRQAEKGPIHNPEFAILEWYAAGEDHFDQMKFVEQLCRRLYQECGREQVLPEQFEQLDYDEAFQKSLGVSVLELNSEELKEIARREQIPIDFESSDSNNFNSSQENSLNEEERKDEWLNLLLAERVEPWLKQKQAVFVHNYPLSQAALARKNPAEPRVAERFELYLQGVEICNGYHELTDPQEQFLRAQRQNELRALAQLPRLPEESRLLEAMKAAGLPSCCGVAVGLDRLLMLAMGCHQLAEVMAFPMSRA